MFLVWPFCVAGLLTGNIELPTEYHQDWGTTMTKKPFVCAFGAACVGLFLSPAIFAEEYEISIDVSDDVLADLDVLEAVFSTSGEDTPLQGNVRRQLNGVLGEVNLQIAESIDENWVYSGNDGTSLLLMPGDVLRVVPKRPVKKKRIVISRCVLNVGPPRKKVKKRIIPACQRICASNVHAAICNTVPPRRIKKKVAGPTTP